MKLFSYLELIKLAIDASDDEIEAHLWGNYLSLNAFITKEQYLGLLFNLLYSYAFEE